MWEIINFCLLLLLVIIIISVLVLCIFYYYKIKSYVDEAISHIGSLIPTFNENEFIDIDYSNLDGLSKDTFINNNFNKDIALLLCNINMSSYNKFSGFDTRLPKNIKLNHIINNNGYIYKMKHKINDEKLDIRIISYRGTKTGDDVITDLDSVQSEMSGYPHDILVHRGFYRLWIPYKDELKEYIKNECDDDTIFLVTGHSLGCASSIFTALLLSTYFDIVKLYMFAPPRVGNQNLIKKLDTDVKNNYAIINIPDLIPNLPPVTFTTIGNTWLYENFSNRYILDYQMGSISLNHRLDTYACGLVENQKFCKDPIWKKIPTLIMTEL